MLFNPGYGEKIVLIVKDSAGLKVKQTGSPLSKTKTGSMKPTSWRMKSRGKVNFVTWAVFQNWITLIYKAGL